MYKYIINSDAVKILAFIFSEKTFDNQNEKNMLLTPFSNITMKISPA